MKKQIVVPKILKQGILFFLALLFAFVVQVFAGEVTTIGNEDGAETDEPVVPVWQNSMISDREPTRRVNQVALRGVFPNIAPAFGESHRELNAAISDAASTLIDNALRLRARTITFSYEVYSTIYNELEVVSVVMYADIAAVTNRKSVISVNFNAVTGERLTLSNVMGNDFPPLPVRILSEWTRDNPERFYAAATAPLSSFYITDTTLVLLFDEFQISTIAGSVGRLEMTLSNILRLDPIPPSEYIIRQDVYNLKMVPIGPIARNMGFYPVHEPSQNRVRIWWDNTQTRLMMDIHFGINRYAWEGITPRTLEAVPVLINGRTMIPITFFDRIMPLTTYHVDENGYIHFITYKPAR
jgi:hypothetical protein